MTFRVALFAIAALTVSGAAHAQALTAPTPPDRVVVDLTGKPMRQVRTELRQAAEAVCGPENPFDVAPTQGCVDATFASALRRVRMARAVERDAAKPTTVASR